MEWKYCPYCNKRINQNAKKCPYCHYDFERNCEGIEIICNSITTKSVNKNGLSFECPIYYDIGFFNSEDEVYDSIVALSKNDEECEIYVMKYRATAFHWKIRKNSNLLMKHLKLHGYDSVTQNKDFEYCFDAIRFSQIGAIKTTLLYNFDSCFEFVIICNRPYYSDYDCVYDLKIINDSISLSRII